ncbi:MAG: hypothetical protein K0R48_884 [Gammaproteobacteria bacterium]|jgi:hypothetical protein|nr:hypothetical protein [Gammaproteobacteria bacterium]
MLENKNAKQIIIERCSGENEKTEGILHAIIHLLTVIKKTYQAMSKLGDGTIILGVGANCTAIDIFSKDFIDTKINPELLKLRGISPVGLSDCAVPQEDRDLMAIMDYAIKQRLTVIKKAGEAEKQVNQFLEHYKARTEGFAPIAYLQLIINLSDLLRNVQTVLEAAHLQRVPLNHRNEFYKGQITAISSGTTNGTSFFGTPSSVSQEAVPVISPEKHTTLGS